MEATNKIVQDNQTQIQTQIGGIIISRHPDQIMNTVSFQLVHAVEYSVVGNSLARKKKILKKFNSNLKCRSDV